MFTAFLLNLFTSCTTFYDLSLKVQKSLNANDDVFFSVEDKTLYVTYDNNPIYSLRILKTPLNCDTCSIYDAIKLNYPCFEVELPNILDSLDFYKYRIGVNLLNDHWREIHHIEVSAKKVKRNKVIFSFTTHH